MVEFGEMFFEPDMRRRYFDLALMIDRKYKIPLTIGCTWVSDLEVAAEIEHLWE